jgi:hypothetical protein
LYFRFEPVTTVSNTSPSHTIQYPQRRQTGYNSIKYKLIENKGVFAEHCAEFNTSHRVNIYLSFVQLKYLKTNLPIRRYSGYWFKSEIQQDTSSKGI